MNIAVIKKLNENIPYWMKRPFARIIRNRLIENKAFLKQYELLEQADSMTEQDLNKLQMDNLKRVLVHAYRHTTYYRELMDSIGFDPESVNSPEALKRLPILTKELLKENYERLQADDIDNFYDVRTGGTTGEPTHVLMEKDAIYREWAFTYHYWSKFGYDYRTSKLATLRGVDLHGKLYEINPLYQEIRLNVFKLNRDNIKEYIQRIDRYGADFIYGYPSAVYNLCSLAKEAGIKLEHRFKAALLISENLYDFQEYKIKDVLACPIAMFYGHSERAVYAEKYDKGYMFQPLYGVTEISEEGNPIVTGFINGKTPLIRYEVDDQVELISEDSSQIKGHWNADILEGKNGERISAAAINFHDTTFEGIEKYQFIQYEAGYCILNIVSETSDIMDSKIADIEKSIHQKFGSAISCKVCVIPELEMTSRGKFQMVVRKSGGGVMPRPIYRIWGHRDRDILYGSNGEQVSVAAINFHDKTFDVVEGYQFVQTIPGQCVLNVLLPDRYRADSTIRLIQTNVSSKLSPGIDCKVQFVTSLQFTERGKYQMIIQKYKKSSEVGEVLNGNTDQKTM